MAIEKVDVMINGGKATAAPPLGPALGPLKINIGQVVAEINKKTADFAGMQVPVTVSVNTETKDFTIKVGTPPASALIKQEAGVKKGGANQLTDTAGNLSFDQVLKIVRMKQDALYGKNMANMAKEIMGTCRSMSITIDGKKAQEAIEALNKGEYNAQLK